jgi:hypothetical protein
MPAMRTTKTPPTLSMLSSEAVFFESSCTQGHQAFFPDRFSHPVISMHADPRPKTWISYSLQWQVLNKQTIENPFHLMFFFKHDKKIAKTKIKDF